MSQGPTPEQAEERLRQALSARAGDMAAGDRAAWDPDRPRPGILPFAAADEPRRGPRWRTVLGAVAALAIPVAGGAVLLADDSEKTPTPPQGPACIDGSTTTGDPAADPAPTTVTVPASILPLRGGGGPTTTGPPPTIPETTTTAFPDPSVRSTTTSVSPPETDTTTISIPEPPTTTSPPGTGPFDPIGPSLEPASTTTTTEPCVPSNALCAASLATNEIVDYQRPNGEQPRVGAVRTAELPDDGNPDLESTSISAGDHEGTLWTSEEGDAVSLDLLIDGVTVTILGIGDEEVLRAVAASVVHNDDGSFAFEIPCDAQEISRIPFE